MQIPQRQSQVPAAPQHLQRASHWTNVFSKSSSVTSLNIRALPMPTGRGRRIPIEFLIRSSIASLKNSRVKSGLWTGTEHLRSKFKIRSRCSSVMFPKICDRTVMKAMSVATASPCMSSCSVPSAFISRFCPTPWPKSTRRSKSCSQRFGASSSSIVSMDKRRTRAPASSAPSCCANLVSTSRGACCSRSSKSSSDFMIAILHISPRLLVTSRVCCVPKKEESKRAATGGT
mmetsp:Transcript_8205/g.26076  ORF Transcript_8205/g.26076 Transcript_8205/m.26076 type:complete len:231 (-) Transcript_8205:645-1337(-)